MGFFWSSCTMPLPLGPAILTGMIFSFKRWSLVGLVSIVVTITLQNFVGKPNLYEPRKGYWRENTLKLHSAILTNHLPSGTTWLSLGANSTNLRVGSVFLAEWLHRKTGKSLFSIYYWMDNAALATNFFLLFLFFELFVSSAWALFGATLFYFFQITTYFNHYFHPWDRISLIFWIVLLALIFKGKTLSHNILTWLVFCVGIFFKFDLIIVTGVATVFSFSRDSHLSKKFLGPAMFVAGLLLLSVFSRYRPGGSPLDFRDIELYKTIIRGNLSVLINNGFTWPPFLMFCIPIVGGLLGWKKMDPFSKTAFSFGLLALPIYFVSSWFHETRAEVPFLLMMMPGALVGLSLLFPEKREFQLERPSIN